QLPAVAKALEITAKQKEDLEKYAGQIKAEILKARPPAAGGGGRPGAAGPGAGGFGGGGVGAGGPGGAAGGGEQAGAGGQAGTGGQAGGGLGLTAQFYKAVEEARDKGMKQAIAILTDEQKATGKKLTG